MRIGYNTWSMASVPYQQFIPGLSDIGFTAIAISVVPGYTIGGRPVDNAASMDRLSADDRRRIKRMFVERGLKLPSLIGNQSLVELDPERNAASMDRLRRTIDLCVELAIEPDEVPTLNTGIAGHSGDLEANQPTIVERLSELAEYARARGAVICIEPHVGRAIDSIERAELIVDAVDSPCLRLDFDISHFEVQGLPMQQTIPRLAPLAGAAEIKDQHVRSFSPTGSVPDAWLVEGNGFGHSTAPNGQELEFQFLLGGEGTFDLAGYLKLMQAHQFKQPIAFEASVQCQARPGYDALTSAGSIYRWMADAWRQAGVSSA